ncbi:hypothetical protein GCM10010168_89080 [Actinoplanes ianthinogenes]|uniref:ATP-binding protein n=1 Tax=Actinoplanes ianthinogenes TaxID=122358 RepID=A0ABM7LQ32_9ACTN|nr:ATP-binding protein [Actinoplanes ianthinogenes]BCJ41332.1 hypothetical protein Aiant_19890 [Actinoplanes ianthinogenes]GGR56354.1 hypothetical protein GCM10010168_89080 [Actinoplanes ianthinogenes]
MTAVLTAAEPSGAWAWTGMRITAAADLTELREYAGLKEEERVGKAISEQITFLAAQLGERAGAALELRWWWRPETATLEAYLLTRVWGPDEPAARAAAEAAASRLSAAPRHVFTAALTDSELHAALQPFTPHPAGAVEVRKRVLVETPHRPDAGVLYYFAVQPFTGTYRSWEPLLRAITSLPHPVVVTVGLNPMPVPGSLNQAVALSASHYKRLATDGEYQHGGLYGGRVKLTPDAFAVEAEKMYADAGRRYQGSAFRIRVAVCAPQPLGDDLPSVIGATISSSERGAAENYLTSHATGATYTLERPSGPQLEIFTRNLGSLSFGDWGGHPVWRGPAPPSAALYPLTWIVDAEEATAAFRLPIAAHGTLPRFPVRARTPAVVADYTPSGPHLVLGGQPDAGPLGVELADLNRHALFLGTTGSGKTDSTLSFVRQLWGTHRVPFTVLEPVNAERDDYRWLATLPGFEELLIFTVGDEHTAPLRLNPFEVPPGVRVATHAANLRACFDAAFGLWDPLPAIYARALREMYQKAGFDLAEIAGEADTWPVLADFVAAITEVTDGLDYAGEVRSNILAASRLRAESLAEGACGTTLSAARSFPVADLLSRPVVIELAAIGDDTKEQALVMALLLNAMTEHYKAHREGSRLAHVTVIEEAHRLLGRPAPGGDTRQGDAQARAAETFANTLAENRKYGEGLVIVEQSPSKLIADAYKNTNLKVMHQLLSAEDRDLIGDTMRFSDDQRAYAGALPKMSAFAFHSRLDRPALVAVDDVRARDAAQRGLPEAPLAGNDELTRRHRAWLAGNPAASAAMTPQAPCGICPVRCSFAYAANRAAEAHIPAFRERMKSWPSARDDRPAWWEATGELLESWGAVKRPHRAGPDDPHWRTAVFVALLEKAYSGDTGRWRALYRDHLTRMRQDAAR